MGENALYSGHTVKIGTCEQMYYLRWGQRHRVTPVQGSLDPCNTEGLYWRLPLPEEDNIPPGGYRSHLAGFKLFQTDNHGYSKWFAPDDLKDAEPGFLQLKHESGLLVNVPCHHGAKLPEMGDCKTFWNGKNHHLELESVKNMDGKLWPIVACRYCRTSWRFDWKEVLPFCKHDKEMYQRLLAHSKVGAAQPCP